LLPEGEFAALALLPDRYLAMCFCIPQEQIPARREELDEALHPRLAEGTIPPSAVRPLAKLTLARTAEQT
jgi:hypothetical protein